MLDVQFKRCLSFLMALVMVLSLTPVTALASEAEEPTETKETLTEVSNTEDLAPTEEETITSAGSELLIQIRNEIAEFIAKYSLIADMTDQELANAYSSAPENPISPAEEILIKAKNLSQEELDILAAEENTILFDRFYNVMITANNPVPVTTVNVLDGQISVTDTANSNTVSDGIVTIEAKGSLFSKKTNTITITNETETSAKLEFAYSASTYNSFTVAGASVNASGTFSGVVEAGASVTIVLVSNSGLSNTTASLTLSSFSLTAAAATSNVTINFDSSLGSVTAAGSAITAGTIVEGVSLESGIALAATANSGTTFLGWINEETGLIESRSESFSYGPTANVVLRAVFVNSASTAWFLVNNAYLYDDLNEAGGMKGASIVVLMNSGTLPAGDYTIPAGVTLLIPFDSANTLYTTKPASTGTTYTKPTAYRTLTMASGANITVNGTISLSGKYKSGSGGTTNTGAPSGPTSFVKMQEGSSITLNNGGALYCYGFITGSGSVTAKSGSTVYELFQFQDWRGGDATNQMKSDGNEVFPISQYYVQNVEVPLELQAGSTCYGFTSVTVSILGEQSASVKVFGPSGSMFNITSGSLTKRYDGATDRIIYEIDGTVELANVEISMGIYSIDSADFDLAINNNITVQINGGSTVNITKDVALLPGTEIIIEQGATCALGSDVNLYVYDVDEWGGYCGTYDAQYIAVTYAPGRTGSRAALDDAKILIKGIADASAGYVYTTAGGANICGEEGGVIKVNPGTQTVTYQYKDQANEYAEIPITSAQLKHGDGSYADTSAEAATYHYAHGVWHKTKEKPVITQVAAQAASCDSVGWNAYEYCSTCDYTTYDEIAALGHSYETVVTAPTCTEAGYTTYTCSACGDTYDDTYVDATGHSWKDGYCSVCDAEFVIYTSNISAGDGLDMFFYVKKADLSGTAYYAVVTKTFADGRADSVATIPYSEWESYNNELIRFCFEDISAKEMKDKIYVTVYNNDGTAASKQREDSIYDYAVRAMAAFSDNQKLLTALVDMLNYGAAAQTYFSYNTDDLANTGIDASHASANIATCEDQHVKGTNYYGTTVSARNQIVLTFYFTGITSDMTAYVSYTDHYGNEETLTIQGTDFYKRSETLYGVDVTGLAVADGRQLVTCVIKDGTTEVASGVDSIESFVARSAENEVFEMLMKFVDSAYAYFHQ